MSRIDSSLFSPSTAISELEIAAVSFSVAAGSQPAQSLLYPCLLLAVIHVICCGLQQRFGENLFQPLHLLQLWASEQTLWTHE
jgi:type IV secretory pathway VirB2 component (pilin)